MRQALRKRIPKPRPGEYGAALKELGYSLEEMVDCEQVGSRTWRWRTATLFSLIAFVTQPVPL